MNLDLLRVSKPQRPLTRTKTKLVIATSRVPAGFPSPAESSIERTIDLNDWLIKNKLATFLVVADGDSMNFEFRSGDTLIVDRSIEPQHGQVVIACLDGEFTVKRWTVIENRHFLVASNPAYPPIPVTKENEFQIWGVVTFAIHKVS
jgi:DNA polymerase V